MNSVYAGSKPVCVALLHRLNEWDASDTERPSRPLGDKGRKRDGDGDGVASQQPGCRSSVSSVGRMLSRLPRGQHGVKGGFAL